MITKKTLWLKLFSLVLIQSFLLLDSDGLSNRNTVSAFSAEQLSPLVRIGSKSLVDSFQNFYDRNDREEPFIAPEAILANEQGPITRIRESAGRANFGFHEVLTIAATAVVILFSNNGWAGEGIAGQAMHWAREHWMITSLLGVGSSVALFFAVWRVFFPVKWHEWRLSSKDWKVRKTALGALDNLWATNEQKVQGYLKALASNYWDVRGAAAEALGGLGDRRVVEMLIERLSDANSYVRRAAAEALGKLGDTRAVVPLIERLSDANSYVRRAAAEALGKLGDTKAVEPLNEKLSDRDKDVRRAVAAALDKLRATKEQEMKTAGEQRQKESLGQRETSYPQNALKTELNKLRLMIEAIGNILSGKDIGPQMPMPAALLLERAI